MGVGSQPGEGAEAAGNHLHRVERALLYRRHAGVRLSVRIPLVGIVDRRAAVERRILARASMHIIFRDRPLQAIRIDPAVPSESSDGPAGLDIAGADMRSDRQRGRAAIPRPYRRWKARVADQPGRDLLSGRHRPQHRRHIVVVAVALVAEASAIGEHTDDTGLAALDDVRKSAGAAIGIGYQGDGTPGCRCSQRVVDAAARGLAEAHAVAGGAGAATVQCGASAGYMARQRARSCGKPPAARTTPRRAWTSTSPSAVPRTAPAYARLLPAATAPPARRRAARRRDRRPSGAAGRPARSR